MHAHQLRLMLRRQNLVSLTAFFLFSVVVACGFVVSGAQSEEQGERE